MLGLFKKENDAKTFLTKEENQILLKRVEKFENQTGCELAFHIRQNLGSDPLKANEALFFKFGLDKTEHRNAILVTVALAERQFAIWADVGVMRQSGDKLWNDISQKMEGALKLGQHLAAFTLVADMSENVLSKEQSAVSRMPNGNELSNKPIIESDEEPQ
ncbi:MAG: TPM domain-containing protein [Oligoflexia bacterium]|nr:TPM domain-containing protein [Oligoflexia bacterium]